MSDRPIAATPEMYRQIFELDNRGAAILADLAHRFSQESVTTGGIDAVLKTYENCGSNKVVRFIDQQIDRGNTGERDSTIDIPPN
jgi:hypothetical protein